MARERHTAQDIWRFTADGRTLQTGTMVWRIGWIHVTINKAWRLIMVSNTLQAGMKIGTPILNWGFRKIQGEQPKEPRLQCVDANLRREVADFPTDPWEPPGKDPTKILGLNGLERNSWPRSRFKTCCLYTWCLYKACTLLPKWFRLKMIWIRHTPSQVTAIEADDYTYNSAMKSLSATGDRARVVDPVEPCVKWGDRHETRAE